MKMGTIPKLSGGWIAVLAVMAVLFSAGAAIAEDCAKAREVYNKWKNLLNYQERRAVFQRAVDLCPSYAEAHCNLADAIENTEETNEGYVKAIAEYKKAIKYKNDLLHAHLGLGINYLRIGLDVKARDAFKKALELDPGNTMASRGLDEANQKISMDKDRIISKTEIIEALQGSEDDEEMGIVGIIMGPEPDTVAKGRMKFNKILFNEWSSAIVRPEAIAQLKEIGNALSSAALKNYRYAIEGHTDNRGPFEKNMQCSRDRAGSVKEHLVKHFNVRPDKITTQGYGPTRERFPNDTEEHMLKNRRVELLVIQTIQQGEQRK